MTDETEEPEEGFSFPDGFIIVHVPADGSEPYGIGPFPPIESLAEDIVANAPCDCKRSALAISFPKGVTMAVGLTTVNVSEVAKHLADLILADPPKEEPRGRLN